jgi:hypothetical protein
MSSCPSCAHGGCDIYTKSSKFAARHRLCRLFFGVPTAKEITTRRCRRWRLRRSTQMRDVPGAAPSHHFGNGDAIRFAVDAHGDFGMLHAPKRPIEIFRRHSYSPPPAPAHEVTQVTVTFPVSPGHKVAPPSKATPPSSPGPASTNKDARPLYSSGSVHHGAYGTLGHAVVHAPFWNVGGAVEMTPAPSAIEHATVGSTETFVLSQPPLSWLQPASAERTIAPKVTRMRKLHSGCKGTTRTTGIVPKTAQLVRDRSRISRA